MTAVLAPTTYTVDPWDPGYGVAMGDDMDGRREASADVRLDVEIEPSEWRPVAPDDTAPLPARAWFLDGVRRIDARVWVHGPDPQPQPALAASLAAGLVCCERGSEAVIADVRVDRGLFTAVAEARDLVTRHGVYTARAASRDADAITIAVQGRLAALEQALGELVRLGEDDVLFLDGSLRAHTNRPRTIGYVKTHHEPYLQAPWSGVVSELAPGERTPLFAITTSWPRHSWYLRLPGVGGSPWSGVVRLECSADLAVGDAVALADLSARMLPRLGSSPHKDARAPQNLVPIGGLERRLRHRLGDAAVLYRALRTAAHAAG